MSSDEQGMATEENTQGVPQQQQQEESDATETHTEAIINTDVQEPSHSRDEVLPEYSHNNHHPSPPSYARVEMADRRRRESLQEFLNQKMYHEDTFGGIKGIVSGPPNDPLKPFRWMSRKFKGQKHVWRTLSEEERRKWEEDGGAADHERGEVVAGDVDTARVF